MAKNDDFRKEKQTLKAMVKIYCRTHHDSKGDLLCSECMALLSYAYQRLENCPHNPEKPPCVQCQIHCYKPGMRQHIRQIMKFSGPRMLKQHPILAIKHLLLNRKINPPENKSMQ